MIAHVELRAPLAVVARQRSAARTGDASVLDLGLPQPANGRLLALAPETAGLVEEGTLPEAHRVPVA